jgi:hypothetical protein
MVHESTATGLALGVARNRRVLVALHKHLGVAGVVEAAAEILTMVPGIELVDLNQPVVGLQSVNVSILPTVQARIVAFGI